MCRALWRPVVLYVIGALCAFARNLLSPPLFSPLFHVCTRSRNRVIHFQFASNTETQKKKLDLLGEFEAFIPNRPRILNSVFCGLALGGPRPRRRFSSGEEDEYCVANN